MANVFDNIVGEKHAVCESSLLRATISGNIFSLKCHKALDNGSIVTYGDYVENQIFAAKDYEDGAMPLLVLTTPIGYNSDRKYMTDECYFYNDVDEIARAYPLYANDIWTVSEMIFQGTPEVGKYIDATYTVSDAAGTGFVGRIIDKVVNGTNVSYRVFVESTGC